MLDLTTSSRRALINGAEKFAFLRTTRIDTFSSFKLVKAQKSATGTKKNKFN